MLGIGLMSTKKWKKNIVLDDWFYSCTDSQRAKFEAEMGVNWETLLPDEKHAALTAWNQITGQKNLEERIERHRKEDRDLAFELQDRGHVYEIELQDRDHSFQTELAAKIAYAQTQLEKAKLEGQKEIMEDFYKNLQRGWDKLAEYFVTGVRNAIDQMQPMLLEGGIKFFEELNRRKLLPESSETPNQVTTLRIDPSDLAKLTKSDEPDVKMQHPGNCPYNGPDNVVYKYIKSDGREYARCMVAYHAHYRSVFGFRFLNRDTLTASGCPLPKSTIIRRQVGAGWFPGKTTEETCPLAKGYEMLNYNF